MNYPIIARLLSILLLITACAPSHKHTLQVSGFESQVNAFQAAGASVGEPLYIDDLIINFGDLSGANEAGLCQTGTETTTPVITIDATYWSHTNDVQKELLLFHELAHCILDRLQHRNDYNSDHMPASIMNYCSCAFTSSGVQTYYMENRQIYIHELFYF